MSAVRHCPSSSAQCLPSNLRSPPSTSPDLPLSDVRRPTSDVRRPTWGQCYKVGGANPIQSGEVFFGRTDGRTADKKRRKNFVLGPPKILQMLLNYRILLVRNTVEMAGGCHV